MPLEFAVTYDYRCPFAWRAHDHVLTALRGGADWDVQFIPFSLGQVHVEAGDPDIWDRPDDDTGLLALQASVVVRDRFPDSFLAVHDALFRARHLDGAQIRDPSVVRDLLTEAGADAAAVFTDIATGTPLEIVRKEHEAAAADFDVWGVPTFIAGAEAAFVRLMNPSDGDADASRLVVERLVGLLARWPDLNEFKHTSIPR
jgi:2-hydroxychromene-2-carboxylate isomerase